MSDPFAYRWFTVRGTLVANGREIRVGEGAHADDLPKGEAGKEEIAERVRKHYAARYDDAAAHWRDLDVYEVPLETPTSTKRSPPRKTLREKLTA